MAHRSWDPARCQPPLALASALAGAQQLGLEVIGGKCQDSTQDKGADLIPDLCPQPAVGSRRLVRAVIKVDDGSQD
jgi:hypothetical protein